MNGNKHPLRIVVDTNVIISFLWGGRHTIRIIDALIEGKVQAAVSVAVLDELRCVAARKKFSTKFSREISDKFINTYTDITLKVSPKENFHVSRDGKDNIFLDCAVEAKADYLITGDGDLLAIGHFRGTNIVAPAAFVRMVL